MNLRRIDNPKKYNKKETQLEYYITHKGMKCPFCKTKNIMSIGQAAIEDNGELHLSVECYDCGKIWTDVYTLIDIIFEEDT